MHTPIRSQALPELVWTPVDTGEPDGPLWVAQIGDQLAQDVPGLATLAGEAWDAPNLRFEAWLAFGLGLDGFLPVIKPESWTEVFDRGPIDPANNTPDGDPLPRGQRFAPRIGTYGLEGLVVHVASGHVMMAHTLGVPGFDLPVLVPLTAGSAAERGARLASYG